jgi:hypothetical protein
VPQSQQALDLESVRFGQVGIFLGHGCDTLWILSIALPTRARPEA